MIVKWRIALFTVSSKVVLVCITISNVDEAISGKKDKKPEIASYMLDVVVMQMSKGDREKCYLLNESTQYGSNVCYFAIAVLETDVSAT